MSSKKEELNRERFAQLMGMTISDMLTYGHDDYYIIGWFENYFNFTEKDFKYYGFGDFVNYYYEDLRKNGVKTK